MIISDKGLDAIKNFEGLRLNAYQCTAGKWTIGYGHTSGVKKGDRITNQIADDFLLQDLKWCEDTVDKTVNIPITQSMYDAMVSLTFNIGSGAFKTSTLLKKLNDGNYMGAANEFGRWIHSGGRVVNGLIVRRSKEKDMFLSDGIPNDNIDADIDTVLPDLSGYCGISIVEALSSKGYACSFQARKDIAAVIGIDKYTGTSKQNLDMIQKLGGKISNVNVISLKGYKGFSIVDGLKNFGYPSDFSYRKKLAEQHGIKNYSGTSKQNNELLKILKSQ